MWVHILILTIAFVLFANANDVSDTEIPFDLKIALWKANDRKVVRSNPSGMVEGETTFNGKTVSFWQIDRNATLKKEYEEHLSKERDFCNDFYDDLFEWKNINIIKPLVFDTTDYNNPVLKKNMGDCWYMDMNTTIRDGFTGRGFTLYKFDNKLLYIMTYRDFRQYEMSFANFMYILDPQECSKIIKDPSYDSYYSRADFEDYRNKIAGDTLIYFGPIKYKSEDYLLFIDSVNLINGLKAVSIQISKFKDKVSQTSVCINSYLNTKIYR
nr:hypothetical protein [uncultured Campylobacter sp.]